MYEKKYDLSGLNFPTPFNEIRIFKKKNSDMSVNVDIPTTKGLLVTS